MHRVPKSALPRSVALAGLLSWASCAHAPTSAPAPTSAQSESGAVPEGTPDAENIARARQAQGAGKRAPLFAWSEFSPAAFARAKAEGRLVLLDCVAVWCHWCHVMDETTYEDPAVAAILRERFVTLRVDVDAHPELSARYESWGWPATVIFNPAGEELGKFRGYLTAGELRAGLEAAQKAAAAGPAAPGAVEPLPKGILEPTATIDSLPWVGARLMRDLDGIFDEDEGGWGRRQKLPIGGNLEVELLRAQHGDPASPARVKLTFEKQRLILDPVWGGLYQYSTGGVWTNPHFEKRLPIQTSAIEALARGYGQTKTQALLDDALRISGYVRDFLQDGDGAFLVSQDADLGGFEGHGRFVDGHIYYHLDSMRRRALGIPRIDRSVYPHENGLGISAVLALAAVVPDPAQAAELTGRARRAAELMLTRFVEADGTVVRSREAKDAPRYLADAAALGRALAQLGARTKESRYQQAARNIASAMLRLFGTASSAQDSALDGERWLLWAHTPDPAAVGVFARRERPFAHNVLAARFLLALGDSQWKQRAQRILAGLAKPQTLDDQGRLIGEYLLALDEAGSLRWR